MKTWTIQRFFQHFVTRWFSGHLMKLYDLYDLYDLLYDLYDLYGYMMDIFFRGFKPPTSNSSSFSPWLFQFTVKTHIGTTEKSWLIQAYRNQEPFAKSISSSKGFIYHVQSAPLQVLTTPRARLKRRCRFPADGSFNSMILYPLVMTNND